MATTLVFSVLCLLALSSASAAVPKYDQILPQTIVTLTGGQPDEQYHTVGAPKEKEQPANPVAVIAEADLEDSEEAATKNEGPDPGAADGAAPASDLDTANTFWGGYGGYGRWGGWGGYYRPYYGGWGWRRNYGFGRGYYGGWGYPYWG